MLRVETIETMQMCSWCQHGIYATVKGTKAWVDEEKEQALHLKCKEKWDKAEAEREVFYTTANDRYDGFGTRTEAVVGKTDRGKEVRKVSILHEHVYWQTMRYSSGIEVAYTQEQYEEAVKYGYVIPSEAQETA